jgi:hypothetical protein
MSAKSRHYRPRHGKRRAIIAGAFGRVYGRKGGKSRNGYVSIWRVALQ